MPISDLENNAISGFFFHFPSISILKFLFLVKLVHFRGGERLLLLFLIDNLRFKFILTVQRKSSMVWFGAQINIASSLWGHTAWLWSMNRIFLETWNKAGR